MHFKGDIPVRISLAHIGCHFFLKVIEAFILQYHYGTYCRYAEYLCQCLNCAVIVVARLAFDIDTSLCLIYMKRTVHLL